MSPEATTVRPFDPGMRLQALGATAIDACRRAAAPGEPWGPLTLRAAAAELEARRPLLAKRLRRLSAHWSVVYPQINAVEPFGGDAA